MPRDLTDSLGLLSDLLKEKRIERRETRELALKIFSIKLAQNAKGLDRLENIAIDVEKSLRESIKERKSIESGLENLGIDYNKAKKVNEESGLDSGAEAVVKATMYRMAGDHEGIKESIGLMLTQKQNIDNEVLKLKNEKIRYSEGVGRITVHDYIQAAGKDKIVSSEEIDNFIAKLGEQEKFSQYIDSVGFQAGVQRGFKEARKSYLDEEAQKSLMHRRYKISTDDSEKYKTNEYSKIEQEYNKLYNFLNKKEQKEIRLMVGQGVSLRDAEKATGVKYVDPESLWKPFQKKIELFKQKFGEDVSGEFDLIGMSQDSEIADLIKSIKGSE